MSAREPASNVATSSDDQVIALVQTGSVPAFGVLYDRYCDRAYRVARSVCRDDGRAQEAVQEAFLSIWRTRATYEPQLGSVSPWLLTVVRYRAIDIARRNDPHAAHRADEDRLDSVPARGEVAEHVISRAQARDLQSLLARLPDAQREVITLAYYGQMTHHEIAAHLELPPGTVKGRMRLGLQRLRSDIKDVVS